MDAYKPENISSDSENLSQELLDIESIALSDEAELSLEMLAEQNEPQTLEEEFADLTQQVNGSDVDNSGDLDLNFNLETDSDVDIDKEFSAFQVAQSIEKADSDESLPAFDLIEINPEIDDVQTDGESSQLLGEAIENSVSDEMDLASELTVTSDLEAISELNAFAETAMPELEMVPELDMRTTDEFEAAVEPSPEQEESLEESASFGLETIAEVENAPESDMMSELDILSELNEDPAAAIASDSEGLWDETFDDASQAHESETELNLDADIEMAADLAMISEPEVDPALESCADADMTLEDVSEGSDPEPVFAFEEGIFSESSSDDPQENEPELNDLGLDEALDVEPLQLLGETIETPMSSELDLTPELAMSSDTEATPDLSDLEVRSETEMESDPALMMDSIGEIESGAEMSPELEEFLEVSEPSKSEDSMELESPEDLEGTPEPEILLEVEPELEMALMADTDISPMPEPVGDENLLLAQESGDDSELSQWIDSVQPLDQEVTEISQDVDVESDLQALDAPQASADEQTAQLLQLEVTIRQNQEQIHDLQSLADSKIDPEIHAHLEQELMQHKEQIASLEDSLQLFQADQAEALASTSTQSADTETLQQIAEEQKQTIAELQETITLLEKEVKDWQIQAGAKIEPSEFDALQTQSDNQGALITKLESEIETLKATYDQSQAAAENKIEPELYQSIQAEVQQLTAQVQDWEARYDSLTQKLEQQTQLANERIDPAVHAELSQQVQAYSEQVQTLESEKAILEETVQNFQSLTDSKVDRMEYEAVLEQLERLKKRNARNLWTRIMDWVKGN